MPLALLLRTKSTPMSDAHAPGLLYMYSGVLLPAKPSWPAQRAACASGAAHSA